MKTVTKTLTLLVVTLSFAACTEQIIEPARAAYVYPQPGNMQTDTIKREPVRIKPENDDHLLFIQVDVPGGSAQPGYGTSSASVANSPLEEVAAPSRPSMPADTTDSLAY